MAETKLTKSRVMHLFKKKVKLDDNKSFDTFFMTFPENPQVAISTRLSDEVKLDLHSEKLDFPMAITLEENHYFLTKEKYETEEGLEKVKVICVITNYSKVEHLELEKYSLDKYLEEQVVTE